MVTHLSGVLEVRLTPDQDTDGLQVLLSGLTTVPLLLPPLHALECLPVGDIVREQDCLGPAVVERA